MKEYKCRECGISLDFRNRLGLIHHCYCSSCFLAKVKEREQYDDKALQNTIEELWKEVLEG